MDVGGFYSQDQEGARIGGHDLVGAGACDHG